MGKNNTTKEDKMIKNLRTFILGTLSVSMIYFYFLSANATPQKNIKITPLLNINNQEENALKYLNKLRQGAGLVPFSSQKQLKLASKNHANYLIKNHTIGHYENSKKAHFTGKFASHRALKTGYNTPLIIENVSSHNQNYKESIDGLMAAIYHRFAFLDFQGDEIGIAIKQNPYNKQETAFVYNISSNALNNLYKNKKNHSKMALTKALDIHKEENKKIITYPFNNQKDVPPVFFNEFPDPLPEYDVSGFPISISFNQAHFNHIKFISFQLFDSNKNLITNTRIHTHKNDPNKRLNKFSFVLFPLNRLEWNHKYHVRFVALVNQVKIEKEWSFTTKNPSLPLHKVLNEEETINVHLNQATIFYFPPQSKNDLLKKVQYNSNFDMEFVDKNSIKLTALEPSFFPIEIKIGKHKLKLNIKN